MTTKSIPYYDPMMGRTKKPIRLNGRKLERYIYDIFRHIYTTPPIRGDGEMKRSSEGKINGSCVESLPSSMVLPDSRDPNPNRIKVNTMIIDRSEWAPVRNGKASVVASSETARELLMANAVALIEQNGGLLVQMDPLSEDKLCEVEVSALLDE